MISGAAFFAMDCSISSARAPRGAIDNSLAIHCREIGQGKIPLESRRDV
jgi:hypothetical protein